MKVLIAENDPDIVKDIGVFLTEKGCSCGIAASPEGVLASLSAHYYDVVVLHISSFGPEEIQLLKFLKTARLDKRVVLTYEDAAVSPAQMDASGIQNLRKPYTLEALFDKISAVGNYENVENDQLFYFNELIVDVRGRTARVKNQQLELTRTEFELLHLFLRNRGLIVSKVELAKYLADGCSEKPLQSSVLYAHVKNLKKKLKFAGCQNYIKTVYGVGYRFEK